ncbi:C1 family peptidase [Desulfovibrio sp. TomC]|uniref:C1 family peptidase n=1 Tax=Desulfovibrio sp. TomC TaxID=1562888 RepID=UPI00057444BD|nr:C1 family peptidase [Desulfovibrio sp. TomC]KHK03800.1 FB22 precursor [Desulfovibrio sp. TomC]
MIEAGPTPAQAGLPSPARNALALALLLAVLPLLLVLWGAIPAAAEAVFGPDDSLETIREKIAQNGYQFTVGDTWVSALPKEQREAMRSRGRIPGKASALRSLAVAPDLPPRASLPAAFDWRDVNGKSAIGPIRNQGSCGSCYAFAAAAAAEGTYNVATRRTNAAVADFSEQYLAFCLGTHGPYSNSFDGCFGADYSYTELLALTVEGITTETAMPYVGDDDQDCSRTGLPKVVFSGWGRAECQDIASIKNAILTYGPVDAAVLTTAAFDDYTGGVFEDGQTSCLEEGADYTCDYTPTDHAIALVGWNDGDQTTPGHWILRNSWGTGWGEAGYMRIAYDAAKVSCSVAYLTYPALPASLPALGPLLLQ